MGGLLVKNKSLNFVDIRYNNHQNKRKMIKISDAGGQKNFIKK